MPHSLLLFFPPLFNLCLSFPAWKKWICCCLCQQKIVWSFCIPQSSVVPWAWTSTEDSPGSSHIPKRKEKALPGAVLVPPEPHSGPAWEGLVTNLSCWGDSRSWVNFVPFSPWSSVWTVLCSPTQLLGAVITPNLTLTQKLPGETSDWSTGGAFPEPPWLSTPSLAWGWAAQGDTTPPDWLGTIIQPGSG